MSVDNVCKVFSLGCRWGTSANSLVSDVKGKYIYRAANLRYQKAAARLLSSVSSRSCLQCSLSRMLIGNVCSVYANGKGKYLRSCLSGILAGNLCKVV